MSEPENMSVCLAIFLKSFLVRFTPSSFEWTIGEMLHNSGERPKYLVFLVLCVRAELTLKELFPCFHVGQGNVDPFLEPPSDSWVQIKGPGADDRMKDEANIPQILTGPSGWFGEPVGSTKHEHSFNIRNVYSFQLEGRERNG